MWGVHEAIKRDLRKKGFTEHEIDYAMTNTSNEKIIEQYRQLQQLQAQCNSLNIELNNKNQQISQLQRQLDIKTTENAALNNQLELLRDSIHQNSSLVQNNQ